VHELHRDTARADGRGHPLDGARTHVAGGEDPGEAGLEQVRRPVLVRAEPPAELVRELRAHVGVVVDDAEDRFACRAPILKRGRRQILSSDSSSGDHTRFSNNGFSASTIASRIAPLSG
jgi:hypothetical protein